MTMDHGQCSVAPIHGGGVGLTTEPRISQKETCGMTHPGGWDKQKPLSHLAPPLLWRVVGFGASAQQWVVYPKVG